MVRDCLEGIFGDYQYANIAINFVRSDGDVRFVPLREWLQSLGLRYYVSPPGYHATIIERFIRAIKELARTILHSLEFRMPTKYLPYLIKEVVRLLSIRYDDTLHKTPWQSFYNENLKYSDRAVFPFGTILSYQDVNSLKTIVKPRLNYGVVLGTEILSGNLIMENFASKSEDRIAIYKEFIKVDDTIKKYFNNYERINCFKYSKVHSFMIINSSEFTNGMSDEESRHENPTDSVGPQDTDSIGECNLTLEIMA